MASGIFDSDSTAVEDHSIQKVFHQSDSEKKQSEQLKPGQIQVDLSVAYKEHTQSMVETIHSATEPDQKKQSISHPSASDVNWVHQSKLETLALNRTVEPIVKPDAKPSSCNTKLSDQSQEINHLHLHGPSERNQKTGNELPSYAGFDSELIMNHEKKNTSPSKVSSLSIRVSLNKL